MKTKTKAPAVKPAPAKIRDKAIKVATTLIDAEMKVDDLLIEIFGDVMRAADHKQFKIVKKSLVLAINKKEGWDFNSLDAIYKDGYECRTPVNKISMISYFIKIKPTLCFDHAEIVDRGFSAVAKAVEITRKEARETPANDDAHQAEEPASAEEHEAIAVELAELEADSILPCYQQAIDLLLQLDEDQVSAVTRTLGSMLQDKILADKLPEVA